MACVNGAGEKMVPMVIVRGKTSASLDGLNVGEAPAGIVFAFLENGWMTEELGEKWFRDVFLKQCGTERLQLLLLDGHSSHESLGLLELAVAVKENIQVLCLHPSHSPPAPAVRSYGFWTIQHCLQHGTVLNSCLNLRIFLAYSKKPGTAGFQQTTLFMDLECVG